MAYTKEQLFAKLQKADAAGDMEAAKVIAAEIRKLSGAPAPAESVSALQKRIAAGDTSAQNELQSRLSKVSAIDDYNPTAGMSGLDKFRAGFAKSAVDTAQGVGQLFGAVDQKTVDDSSRYDAALMDTGAGLAGNIAGQVTQMAVPGGAAGKAITYGGRARPFIQAAVTSGVFAGSQPVLSGQSRGMNTAKGAGFGVAGQGAGQVVGRVAKGSSEKLSKEVLELYTKARAAGIPVHYSQLSDSKFVKTLASTMSYLPFSGAGKVNQSQQEAFNKAVGRSFGLEDAKTLSDEAMTAARNKVSGIYEDVYSRNSVVPDTKLFIELGKLKRQIGSDLTDDAAKVANAQIEKIISSMKSGSMTGQKYQRLRGELAKVAASNQGAASAIKDTRLALDKVANRSVGGDDSKLLSKANSQWANLNLAKDALKQVEGAKGNVRPASLWNLIKKGSTPEMRELAKVGQFIKDPVPDSGTAGRLFTGGLATGIGTGGLANIPTLAAMVGTGATLGRIANSPRLADFVVKGAGKPINGLARLTEKGLPRLAPAMAPAGSPVDMNEEIKMAAMQNPERGAEILSNLPAEMLEAGVMEFAAANELDAAEIMRRAVSERQRVKQLMGY